MRNLIRMTTVVMVLGFTVSMAKDPGSTDGMDKGRDTAQYDKRGEGMDHRMMWRGRHEEFTHHRMGPHGMMEAQIVPSSDGGVIVMRGGTLYKYDKDLNLKKQVDLPRPEWMKEPMGGKGPMRRQDGASDSSAPVPSRPR